VRRQKTFFEEDDYKRYINIAADLLTENEIGFWAYCLMPNHIHAIVVPRTNDALSRFFATLHRRYARITNAKYEWRGHLWQERFFSVVMREPHALAAMRYVELNPVRSGLVRFAHEWQWSSARLHLGLEDDPLVCANATAGVVSDWRKYLDEALSDSEFDAIRRQTRTGRPEGPRNFIQALESISGRRVEKRKSRRGQK
jgi:putative transposase